ncbi:MAG: OmpA family protein [Phycisphaerales bacterium]
MSDEHKEKGGEAHGEDGHAKPHGRHSAGGHGHGGGHDEHGGVAEWLISFADNVALLMGFFVILLAMNMDKPKPGHGLGGDENMPGGQPDDRLNELVYGIRSAFNNLPRLDSKDPKDAPLIEYMERRTRGETTENGPIGLKPRQQAIKPSDYNAPTGVFPFDTGSSTVSASNRELAQQLGQRLRGQNYIIDVRGHVSAIEAAEGLDASLDLSYRRARAVAAALVANGLRWQNLRISACGDSDRRVPIAADRVEHKTNQRVEIILTNETISADPHAESK